MGNVYATTTDFQRLGLPASALGGDDPTPWLAAASAKADTYLRNVYTLPLVPRTGAGVPTWDPALTGAVCAIAAWDYLAGKGSNPAAGTVDEAVRLRYQDAIRLLESVAKGTASFDVTDSSPAPQEPETGLFVITNPRRGWGQGGAL